MSFQLGIGSLSGTVFFRVGLCTPLRTMRSFFFNKVNRVNFHFLVLQVIHSEAAVYK